jgi:hypothetical protein
MRLLLPLVVAWVVLSVLTLQLETQVALVEVVQERQWVVLEAKDFLVELELAAQRVAVVDQVRQEQ